MEKSQRITAQIYGYAICLVAVLTFIFSTISLVNSVFDLGDPIHSGYTPEGSPSLASYENYKMDVMRLNQKGNETNIAQPATDEQTLKAMYEAAKNDKIQSAKHQANKSITISGIMIVIAFVLFFTHWRWMKRIGRTDS
jgi:hypothetical protein